MISRKRNHKKDPRKVGKKQKQNCPGFYPLAVKARARKTKIALKLK